jgi:hypothetical protein
LDFVCDDHVKVSGVRVPAEQLCEGRFRQIMFPEGIIRVRRRLDAGNGSEVLVHRARFYTCGLDNRVLRDPSAKQTVKTEEQNLLSRIRRPPHGLKGQDGFPGPSRPGEEHSFVLRHRVKRCKLFLGVAQDLRLLPRSPIGCFFIELKTWPKNSSNCGRLLLIR